MSYPRIRTRMSHTGSYYNIVGCIKASRKRTVFPYIRLVLIVNHRSSLPGIFQDLAKIISKFSSSLILKLLKHG